MSSSRRSSKSEVTSAPSSGSNSKRSSLSSKSSTSSTSGKEEIIDLGFTEDPDEAEKNARKWIMNEMKEPAGSWVSRWGKKLTSGSEAGKGLANLGRVIGQDFIATTRENIKDQKANNATYRVDWDTTKGRHFNATIILKVNERIIAYPFGKLENDLQPHPISKKASGEQSIIEKMLAMTSSALDNNELMTPEVAQKILKTFENPAEYVKEYFKEFGSLLRRFINETHKVILQSDKVNDDSYKFDSSKLSGLVSDHLYEIWSPTVNNQLQSILEGSPTGYENRNVLQILLNECAYAASDDKLSTKVLNQFSKLLTPYDDNHIKIFINHLIESTDPNNEAKLQKFQEKIFLLRHSPSAISSSEDKPEQPTKSTSSTANAMLAMMSSRSQATQVLKQSLQPSITTEATMSLNSLPSVSKITSSLAKVGIDNTVSDKKEDNTNTDGHSHGMR